VETLQEITAKAQQQQKHSSSKSTAAAKAQQQQKHSSKSEATYRRFQKK